MSHHYVFHGPAGRSDFLGLRRNARGHLEVVYDDGGRRLVWRVDARGTPPETAAERVRDALSAAMLRDRVIPALHSELSARKISLEQPKP